MTMNLQRELWMPECVMIVVLYTDMSACMRVLHALAKWLWKLQRELWMPECVMIAVLYTDVSMCEIVLPTLSSRHEGFGVSFEFEYENVSWKLLYARMWAPVRFSYNLCQVATRALDFKMLKFKSKHIFKFNLSWSHKITRQVFSTSELLHLFFQTAYSKRGNRFAWATLHLIQT